MQPTMPSRPTTHGSGVLNTPRRDRVHACRSTSIAAQTAMKAASVPALASAAISSSGMTPATIATTTAVKIVIRDRHAAARHPRQAGRQQAVAGHGEEDAALAEQEGQDHGRQGDRRPTAPRILAAQPCPISRRISASGSGLLAKTV